MAQKDAIIRNLERQIEEKDRELSEMKESIGSSAPVVDERVREIEKRIMHLESNIKGLTDEVLDLKAIVMKLTADSVEKSPVKPRVVVSRPEEDDIQVRKESTKRVAARSGPAARAGLEDEENTAMIMQTDGTLKPEKRPSNSMIVAQSGNAMQMPPPRKSTPERRRKDSKKEEEIIVGKRSIEKRNVEPVIFAQEDDSVEIKKKKA